MGWLSKIKNWIKRKFNKLKRWLLGRRKKRVEVEKPQPKKKEKKEEKPQKVFLHMYILLISEKIFFNYKYLMSRKSKKELEKEHFSHKENVYEQMFELPKEKDKTISYLKAFYNYFDHEDDVYNMAIVDNCLKDMEVVLNERKE